VAKATHHPPKILPHFIHIQEGIMHLPVFCRSIDRLCQTLLALTNFSDITLVRIDGIS